MINPRIQRGNGIDAPSSFHAFGPIRVRRDGLPLAESIFPGRNSLMIHEVAKALNCTNQHVIDLVEEEQIVAVDIAGPADFAAKTPANAKTARRCLRVPLGSYDKFVTNRVV